MFVVVDAPIGKPLVTQNPGTVIFVSIIVSYKECFWGIYAKSVLHHITNCGYMGGKVGFSIVLED